MSRHHVVGMWSLLGLLQMIAIVSAMAVNVSMTPPVNVRQALCKLPWVDWSGSDSHCYYFSGTYTAYTWYEAEQECVQQGADDGLPGSHLVSIHSSAEESFINTYFGWTSAVIYVGLQQSAVGSPDYRWSDGTPLVYTNWEAGEPDTGDAALQCSYFSRDADKWLDQSCTTRVSSNYACKAGTAVTTAAPTTRTPGCPVPWVSWRDHCYLFYNDATDRTWSAAQDACIQFGARDGLTGSYLASIHSEEEDLFINSYYSGVKDTYVWIGLQQTQVRVNDFKWVDGTPKDYDAWYSTQPDSYNSDQLVCVFMIKQGMTMADWWDNYCTNAYKHFVCKSYLEGSTGTTSTTTTTTTTTTTPTTTTTTTSSTASTTTTTPSTGSPTATTPSSAPTTTTPSSGPTTATTPSTTATTPSTTATTPSTTSTTPSSGSTSPTTPSTGFTTTTTPSTGSTSTTPSPPSDGSSTTPPQDDGSGGGGIAAIIVVVGVGAVGIAGGVIIIWRRKKSALQSKTQSGGGRDIDTTSLGGNSMATTSSTTQILPSTGISFNHGNNSAMYFSNPESDA